MDRSMKACLGMILVGAVALLVWRFQADKYNVSKPYHNDEFGFSILYPESWEATTKIPNFNEDFVVAFLSDGRDFVRENAIIGAYSAEPDESLDDFMDSLLEGENEIGGGSLQILDQGRRDINGRDARWCVCGLTISEGRRRVKVQFLTYVFRRESDLFEITCTTRKSDFDAKRDVFEKICQSFTLE